MALNPNKLAFARQTLYVPVSQFSGLVPRLTVVDAAVSGSLNIGVSADANAFTLNGTTGLTADVYSLAPVKLVSASDAIGTASELEEISTSGIMGLKMNTAGNRVDHLMPIPNHWDRGQPIYVRPAWTSASTTVADTIDWIFGYRQLVRGTTALTASNVALTAIQDTADATANTVQETTNFTIPAGTFNNTTNSWMKFYIIMNDFAVGLSESKYLLGVTFEFTPNFGRNIQSESEAKTFGQLGTSLTHGD